VRLPVGETNIAFATCKVAKIIWIYARFVSLSRNSFNVELSKVKMEKGPPTLSAPVILQRRSQMHHPSVKKKHDKNYGRVMEITLFHLIKCAIIAEVTLFYVGCISINPRNILNQ